MMEGYLRISSGVVEVVEGSCCLPAQRQLEMRGRRGRNKHLSHGKYEHLLVGKDTKPVKKCPLLFLETATFLLLPTLLDTFAPTTI